MEHFIPQFDEESCGLSSLRMLLVSLSKKKEMANLSLPSHPPYSLDDLSKASEKVGYDLFFYESQPSELDYPSEKKEPFLALLGDKANGHLVMISKISKKHVFYLDPAEGRLKAKKGRFIAVWSGIWGSARSVADDLRPPLKKKPLVKRRWLLFSAALLLLEEICLLMAFLFISKEGNFLYPILFLSSMALLEVSRHFYLIKRSKDFDAMYLKKAYDPDQKRFKNNYRYYNAYKKDAFGGSLEAFQGLSSALLIYFLVGINVPSFFISGGVLMILAMGDSLLSYRRIASDKGALSRLESSLWGDLGEKEKLSSLSRLSSKSNAIGERLVYRRIIYLVMAAMLAFIPLFLEKAVSLDFYLFMLVSSLAVAESFKRPLAFILSSFERKASEGYFREYLAKNEPIE